MQKNLCCPIGLKDKAYSFLLDHLSDLKEEGEKLHFAKGQIIYYQEHEPYGLFWLRKGGVSFVRQRKGGQECEVSQPSDNLLGLVHLLTETPYCASCRAEEEVELVFFPKTAVSTFLQTHEK